MPRVKGGYTTRQRRKKVLKLAKGYFGSKHRLYKTANEQVMRSLKYAYRDRKQKKREFRKLWITRINAAAKMNDFSYSKLINGLTNANIEINRKMLSEMAIHDPKAFTELVEIAKKNVGKKANVQLVVESTKQGSDVYNAGTTKPAKTTTKPASPKKEAKVEKKVEVKTETNESTDFSKLKVAELKELAQNKGITIPAGAKKADIVELLSK